MKNYPCIKRAYAENSLFEFHGGLECGGHTSSQSYAGSTQVETGDFEVVATDVLSRVLSAAKLVGLSSPTPSTGGLDWCFHAPASSLRQHQNIF